MQFACKHTLSLPGGDLQTPQNGIEWSLLYAEPSNTNIMPCTSSPTVASLCDQADHQRLFASVTQNNVPMHPLQPHNLTNFQERLHFLMNATLCRLSWNEM